MIEAKIVEKIDPGWSWEPLWLSQRHLGGVLGHFGDLSWPLWAVLGDLEASCWRLGLFGPRLGALGEGELELNAPA